MPISLNPSSFTFSKPFSSSECLAKLLRFLQVQVLPQ